MYLPRDINSTTREMNSRRRSAAASMNSRQRMGLSQPAPLDAFETFIKPTRREYYQQDIYKHGKEGKRVICPWCISEENQQLDILSNSDVYHNKLVSTNLCYKHDVTRELYVLDDRLYDYIEENAGLFNNGKEEENIDLKGPLFHETIGAEQFLRYCVKVSQLVSALNDDDYYLESQIIKPYGADTTNVIDKKRQASDVEACYVEASDLEASDVEAKNHDQQYESGNYKKVFLCLSDFIVVIIPD